MAANKGMVAGSHNRNEFVMIRHDGDAPAPVRPPNAALAACFRFWS
jgi:cellulose synthase A